MHLSVASSLTAHFQCIYPQQLSILQGTYSFLFFPFDTLWQIVGSCFLVFFPFLPGIDFHICVLCQVALQPPTTLEWTQTFSGPAAAAACGCATCKCTWSRPLLTWAQE